MFKSIYLLILYLIFSLFNIKKNFQYITVHIDINLWNRDYSEQIRVQIQSTNAKYKIESNSIVSHSITWSRQIVNTYLKNYK